MNFILNVCVALKGPGDILPSKNKKIEDGGGNKAIATAPENSKKSPNSVEEWEELQLKADFDALDTRKRPEYKISYKQDVKTEDVFLQVMITEFNIFILLMKYFHSCPTKRQLHPAAMK